MQKLEKYNLKRNFNKTPEPIGEITGRIEQKQNQCRFVVQYHVATTKHFDLRLEHNGVMLSWAVPKGASFNPKDKRLAIKVEDHPIEYNNFEGTIPPNNYGAGTVMIWDEGKFIENENFSNGLKKGSLKFELKGKRLKGSWALVKIKNDTKQDAWLLIKENDKFKKTTSGISRFKTSVRTNRTIKEIENNSQKNEKKSIKSDKKNEKNSKIIEKNSKKPAKSIKINKDLAKLKNEFSKNIKNNKNSTDKDKSNLSNKNSSKVIVENSKKISSLPFKKVDVQLAVLKDENEIPTSDDFGFEIKYDGYRVITFVENQIIKMYTRNGKDYTKKFNKIAENLKNFLNVNAVLDGEVVAFDKNGKTDFQTLQNSLKLNNVELFYVVFDILAINNEDLRNLTLIERKEILKKLLKTAPKNIILSDLIVGNGQKCFEFAKNHNLEGIMAKKLDSKYLGKRTDDWIKFKCYKNQEFVIGGYTTSNKVLGISSLLLGVYKNKKLFFVGKTGTGFTEKDRIDFENKFKKNILKNSPFENDIKISKTEKVFFISPKFVCQVQFSEFTNENLLRQASFKGFRVDKNPKNVVLEENLDFDFSIKTAEKKLDDNTKKQLKSTEKTLKNEQKTLKNEQKTLKNEQKTLKKTKKNDKNFTNFDANFSNQTQKKKTDGKQQKIIKIKKDANQNKIKNINKNDDKVLGIKISNPDKILYKNEKITKLDVIKYYEKISDLMLPYAKNRLLSVVRCHSEEKSECFFKKHPIIKDKAIKTIKIENEKRESDEFFYISTKKGLILEAQLGTIEFHPSNFLVQKPNSPNIMIFDLDPDENLSLEKIREGVILLKKYLDKLNLKSFLKTSGGKGYHIVIPFSNKISFEKFNEFAQNVAENLVEKHPKLFTTNMRKENRQGKIFIDYLRNKKNATSVCPYSLRARTHPTISCPIFWSELDKIAPNDITILNIFDRKKNPWKDFFKVKQKLPKIEL